MLFNYGVMLCMVSLYCSSVMARPGPFYPRAFTNTTTSSSITPSGHVQTSITVPTITSTISPSNTSVATSSIAESSSITEPSSTTPIPTGCQPSTTHDWFGSICISYCAVTTTFAFAPNTTQTVIQFVTLSGNTTAMNSTRVPQGIQTLPPQPCFTPSAFETTIAASQTVTGTLQPPAPTSSTTVSYITSKTTVVSFVSSQSVGFGVSTVENKQSVTPTILQPPASSVTDKPQSQVQPTTSDGAALEHRPTQILTPVPPQSQSRVPSQGSGQSQVNPSSRPSQIIPPGTTIGQATSNPGAPPTSNPKPTITEIATIGSVTLSEIGSTVIIGSQTFTLGPSASPTAVVINSQTFSLGPSGVGALSTTLFIPPPPQTTQALTAGGVTFSEIGSSIIIIGSDTITLGAQPTPTTTTIDGVPISIGPGGVGIGGSTTITAPPAPAPTTETITAGGITFSEIGSTIVVIGGTTFTIGPSAKPTTDIFNFVTISIGPGGVGFPSTTVSYEGSPSATSTASASGELTVTSAGVSSRKEFWSASGAFGLAFSFCIALWVALG